MIFGAFILQFMTFGALQRAYDTTRRKYWHSPETHFINKIKSIVYDYEAFAKHRSSIFFAGLCFHLPVVMYKSDEYFPRNQRLSHIFVIYFRHVQLIYI